MIIKQEYNAAGKGNIGVTICENQHFVGVINTIAIKKNESIKNISQRIWLSQVNFYNQLLIVEVYYPNKGTFTAQYWVPVCGKVPTLLNYSEIIMEPNWVGIQIPPQILSRDDIESLVAGSKQFADLMQGYGYQGYLCCDTILTNERKILFTEINVRPGAETHAYVLARHFFGEGYESRMVVLTRGGIKTNSFLKAYGKLKAKNLLLINKQNSGIAFLTVDESYAQKLEYLIAAPDLAGVHSLEKQIADSY